MSLLCTIPFLASLLTACGTQPAAGRRSACRASGEVPSLGPSGPTRGAVRCTGARPAARTLPAGPCRFSVDPRRSSAGPMNAQERQRGAAAARSLRHEPRAADDLAEQARVQGYYEIATGPRFHANFPTSSHCAAPVTHPAEYEQTLVEFFEATLRK